MGIYPTCLQLSDIICKPQRRWEDPSSDSEIMHNMTYAAQLAIRTSKFYLVGSIMVLAPTYCSISRETRNVEHAGLPSQRNGHIICSSIQKVGNWRWLTAYWSALSIGLSRIKLLYPGPQGASTLNDLCMTCTARGSPKVSQPGPKVTNSPNDIYTVYMT